MSDIMHLVMYALQLYIHNVDHLAIQFCIIILKLIYKKLCLHFKTTGSTYLNLELL